jgi:hypothetical protein
MQLRWPMTVARYRVLDQLRRKRPELERSEEGEEPLFSMADTTEPGRSGA